MSTHTSTLTLSRTRTSPLALWHLLSLDAPSVAALWTWFVAAASGLTLPPTSILAMGVAVWMLYAADRLLDARLLDTTQSLHQQDLPQAAELEHRHRFHHRHRSAFLLGILGASIALALLLPHLHPEAIRLYLVLGTLLAGYFILIHATGSAHRLPKEIAVGLFFSAAVFIPTVARAPNLQASLAPAAALFALLCTLNCLFIYAWEHAPSPTSTTHPATRLALSHLQAITWLSVAANITLAFLTHLRGLNPSPHYATSILPVACAASSVLLLALHHHRRHLTPTTLRAAADLALLTPILLLPFLP